MLYGCPMIKWPVGLESIGSNNFILNSLSSILHAFSYKFSVVTMDTFYLFLISFCPGRFFFFFGLLWFRSNFFFSTKLSTNRVLWLTAYSIYLLSDCRRKLCSSKSNKRRAVFRSENVSRLLPARNLPQRPAGVHSETTSAQQQQLLQ